MLFMYHPEPYLESIQTSTIVNRKTKVYNAIFARTNQHLY